MTIAELTLFELPTIGATFGDDTARVRKSDPLPSHEAADSNTTRAECEAFVTFLFKKFGPMTDRELARRFFADDHHPDADFETPRKRRSDLTKRGQVLATTQTRPSLSGRNMTVWTLRPETP